MKYQHSSAFWKAQWKKFRDFQKNNPDVKENLKVKNFNQFKDRWNSVEGKDRMKAVKDSTMYVSSRKTAKAAREVLEFGGRKKPKIKDLRNLTTAQIAELIGTDIISEFYRNQKKKGLTSREAAEAVSEMFYGS